MLPGNVTNAPLRLTMMLCILVLALGASRRIFAGPMNRAEIADPFENTNSVAVVLLFLAVDCPISNKYAPEIKRLAGQFTAAGVSFWIIYPDRKTTSAQIKEHIQNFGLNFPTARDPNQVLVKTAKARVTPHAAVFKEKKLIYAGRIDNRFAELGKQRARVTERDLANTLQQIVNGVVPPSRETKAVGCAIPLNPATQ